MSDLGLKFKIGADNAGALNSFKELKTQLTSLRDQIKSAVSEVKIKITADSASLTSEINTIKNQIKTQLSGIEAEVKVKADTASIASSAITIKNQLRAAIGMVDIDLRINANTASITSQAPAIRSQINAALGTIAIHLGFDLSHLSSQLAHVKTTINNNLSTAIGAVRINLAITQADLAAIKAKLTTLSGAAKIKLGIDLVYLNTQIAHAKTMLASLVTGGIHINIDASATGLIASLHSLKTSIDLLRASMGSGGGGGGGGSGSPTILGGGLKNIAAMAAGVVGLTAVVTTLHQTVQSQREFDVLNAQLETATKSSEGAKIAFEALQEFAKKTPYSLDQAVTGFTKLVNLGLTPSERALTSYGNTASAMGKDLMQFIEAVADASTSEFERLKEFGIKAKQEGDKVSLTFQGVTKTIGNNAKEIEDYLIAIGENEFAGSMAKRVDTLDGVISALKDSWNQLFLAVSEAGVGDVIKEAVQDADSSINDLIKLLKSGAIQSALGGITRGFSIFGSDAKSDIESIGSSFTWLGDHMKKVWKDTMNNINTASNVFTEVRAMIQKATVSIAAFVDIVSDPFNRKTTNKQKQENYDSSIAGINSERDSRIDSVKNGFEQAELLLYYQKLTELEEKNKKKDGDRLAQFGLNQGNNITKADEDAKKKAADEKKRKDDEAEQIRFEREKSIIDFELKNIQLKYDLDEISYGQLTSKKTELSEKLYQLEISHINNLQSRETDKNKKSSLENDRSKSKLEKSARDDDQYADYVSQVKKISDARSDITKSLSEKNIELSKQFMSDLEKDLLDIEKQYNDAQEKIDEFSKKLKNDKYRYQDPSGLVTTISSSDITTMLQQIEEQRATAIVNATKKAIAQSIVTDSQKIIEKQVKQEDAIGRAKEKDGGWSELTANRGINSSRQQAYGQLSSLRDQLKDSGLSEFSDEIKSIDESMAKLQERIPTTFQAFSLGIKQAAGDALASGINTFFNDLIDGSKSAGEALKDFVRNFIKSIAQIIVQAMAAYAALLILNAIPGGTAVAKALDIAATVKQGADANKAAKQHHTGGIVGRDGKDVQVGSASDIKSNEVLTVLEKGEEVLTARDPRHRNNIDPLTLARAPRYHVGGVAGMKAGGELMNIASNITPASESGANQAQPQSVSIKTFIGDELMVGALETTAGEKAFLNVVSRNSGAIKYILGNN